MQTTGNSRWMGKKQTNKQTNQGTLKGLNNKGAAQ